jgi:peptidyl-prolyl cis-trans isomerase C
MSITVNGSIISDEAIEREAAFHNDTESPREAAARALAVRELLLQRARALGIEVAETSDEACDKAIDAVLEREARTPEPTDEECARYYRTHASQYRSGDLAEVDHILFAVTPNAPVEAIRQQAEATLRQVISSPALFASLAARFSNCPSGANGGNLGQLQRSDTVPEFAAAVFDESRLGVLPRLVHTRYGFHIVRVVRRVPGVTLDFEAAKRLVAEELRARVKAKAAQQYLRLLAAQARIEGLELQAAGSPLVQ